MDNMERVNEAANTWLNVRNPGKARKTPSTPIQVPNAVQAIYSPSGGSSPGPNTSTIHA